MPKRLLKGMIRVYQRYISPFKGKTCRYYPTCSQYAYEAIDKYGAVKGLGLAIKRVARCHPFAPGGYDPVP